jgi:hypothetical protein
VLVNVVLSLQHKRSLSQVWAWDDLGFASGLCVVINEAAFLIRWLVLREHIAGHPLHQKRMIHPNVHRSLLGDAERLVTLSHTQQVDQRSKSRLSGRVPSNVHMFFFAKLLGF